MYTYKDLMIFINYKYHDNSTGLLLYSTRYCIILVYMHLQAAKHSI